MADPALHRLDEVRGHGGHLHQHACNHEEGNGEQDVARHAILKSGRDLDQRRITGDHEIESAAQGEDQRNWRSAREGERQHRHDEPERVERKPARVITLPHQKCQQPNRDRHAKRHRDTVAPQRGKLLQREDDQQHEPDAKPNCRRALRHAEHRQHLARLPLKEIGKAQQRERGDEDDRPLAKRFHRRSSPSLHPREQRRVGHAAARAEKGRPAHEGDDRDQDGGEIRRPGQVASHQEAERRACEGHRHVRGECRHRERLAAASHPVQHRSHPDAPEAHGCHPRAGRASRAGSHRSVRSQSEKSSSQVASAATGA